MIGQECASIIAREEYQPIKIPFTCGLKVESSSNDISVDNLFTVTPVFLSKTGNCLIKAFSSPEHEVLLWSAISVSFVFGIFPSLA